MHAKMAALKMKIVKFIKAHDKETAMLKDEVKKLREENQRLKEGKN
jgi:hypothetical protein